MNYNFKFKCTSSHNNSSGSTWWSSSVVNRVTCSAPVPSSILYVHACHPRGALPVHWACKMLSGPWRIVVVRASWSGHPTIIKKKKKQLWKLVMIELIKKIILYILLFILFYALLLYFFNITKKSPVKKNDWNNQNNPI